MRVDRYERYWMIAVGVILTIFFATVAVAAVGGTMMPPSHVETIDPTAALSDARFRQQGVWVDRAGRVEATVVATAFTWLPAAMTVPANTPVTFHITSIDVVHGFEIVRTDGQTMAIPGYVSQFTERFAPGEYLILCNEYCGVGHHLMSGKMTVVPADQWHAPAAIDGPPQWNGGGAHDHH
jgi:cytochrome c oxidase subunit 2